MSLPLNKIVAMCRNMMYGGVVPDDTVITKRMMMDAVQIERAFLVKEYLDKHRRYPETIVQSLGGLELETVRTVNVGGIEVQVPYPTVRTVLEIPTPIVLSHNSGAPTDTLTFVGTADYKVPFHFTNESQVRWSGYRKWTSTEIFAFYRDNRIYVVNGNDIGFVGVRGVFENPEQAASFTNGACTDCFFEESIYPIMDSMLSPLIQRIQDIYMKPLMMKFNQDTHNDGNDKSDADTTQRT